MGFSITIGRIALDLPALVKAVNEDEDSSCINYALSIQPCEGVEPEGTTSAEYGIDSGRPERSPSYSAWSQFMSCCEPLRQLGEEIAPRGSDGYCFLLNTTHVKSCIDALEREINSLDSYNQDRAKWLIFWTREAVYRYNDEAAIGFW